MENAIGIDLGTTFCSCAYYINNSAVCIEFETGKKILPSIVKFDKDVLVGESATSKNTISKSIYYDSKKYIAKEYNEIDLEYLKNCSYDLINRNNLPYYELENRELKTPTEVSSEIFKYIFNWAKVKVVEGKYIKDAVITVPANFRIHEREETKKQLKWLV